jgi:hypothetical protein
MILKRTAAWLLILLLPILTLAACDRLSLSAATLGVGDCFQEPEGETIEDVQRAPCTEPHTGEVIFTGEYPNADAYPTQEELESWVQANCIDSTFQAFTGRTFEEATDIELGYFSPTSEGWGKGDRQMTCYLVPTDGLPRSTSYKVAPAAS